MMSAINNTTAVPHTTHRQRLKKWWSTGLEHESILGYVLIAPMLLVVLGLIGYPFVSSIYYSMTNKLLAQPEYEFIGLQNYASLLNDPIFIKTLINTFNYSVTAVVIKLLLGLIMALCLNEIVRMRRIIRAAFLLPWVAPPPSAFSPGSGCLIPNLASLPTSCSSSDW
ncbi:MAG: sugar ABC transporter permease [Anaerolineae bacterium]|nr:sugar ABC transporter permease [Anaerolineae bacterium]